MSHFNGPLTPRQWEALAPLVADFSNEQLLWVSGYLAGLGASRPTLDPTPATRPSASQPAVTVLFGSQTGNAEKLAQMLQRNLQQRSVASRIESMGSYKTAQIKRDRCLLIVVSTHGEGDPPDNAQTFYEFLYSKKAPRLDDLRYSVLSLGDTSYEYFCKTGRDIDSRLEQLGATRLHDRVDCDVDFEESAQAWIDAVSSTLAQAQSSQVAALPQAQSEAPEATYSKKHPFPARLLDNIRLTARGSSKDVRHIELSLQDSGLRYEPGDSLGVLPLNWPQRVHELAEALQFDLTASIPGPDAAGITVGDALLGTYEITTLTRPFLEKYAKLADCSELTDLLTEANRDRLREFLYGREIIDVVRRYPIPGITAERFFGLLRKLPPRLYSIASSYQANPDEVHLTVAVVRYESHGLGRQGVASTFLADRIGEDGQVRVYVDSNPNFRLPAAPETAVIMIGPGTGVAPFRAFMSEREVMAATGKNWLFFGDRNFDSDFLYQQEWLDHRRNGLLNRIDVAFSRDGDHKVYVQHRMRENSRELYAWLEQGAHLYVCGDAEHMAKDVHEALITLVAQEGRLSRERAEEYVQQLQSTQRYQRDIY